MIQRGVESVDNSIKHSTRRFSTWGVISLRLNVTNANSNGESKIPEPVGREHNPPPFPELLLTTDVANPHSTISGAIHERRERPTREAAFIAGKHSF
jgi:hypothetical protein